MKPDLIATVACITVCCYLIGIAVKAYGRIDKWGIASGLASTGVNQVVKQLSQVTEPVPDIIDPEEDDEE